MRETKTFAIDGLPRKITVRELTVAELIDVLQSLDLAALNLGELRSVVFTRVLPLVTDLTEDEFISLAPSRLKKLWGYVQEVNGAFFGFASLLGLDEAIEAVRRQFIGTFSSLLASLSRPATSTSSSTDSPTSSTR